MLGARVDLGTLRRDLAAKRKQAGKRMREVLDRVGQMTVAELRGYTGEMQPKRRPAHPGGWADRTGKLAESYDYEVRQGRRGWELIILNRDSKAVLVEAMEGYFVVSGVAESGGPVDRALAKAIRQIAPEWEVR